MSQADNREPICDPGDCPTLVPLVIDCEFFRGSRNGDGLVRTYLRALADSLGCRCQCRFYRQRHHLLRQVGLGFLVVGPYLATLRCRSYRLAEVVVVVVREVLVPRQGPSHLDLGHFCEAVADTDRRSCRCVLQTNRRC